MNETRFAGRVGAFVVLGIVLVGVLFLVFSKGFNLFTPTYELRLHSATVGGLKPRATVLLNGVPIGHVVRTEVAPDGQGVIIVAQIEHNYRIHSDARFAIEQIGLLGDQFVSIYQQNAQGPLLAPGAEVSVEEPLNIEKTFRSAAGLLQRMDQTIKILNEVMLRVDRTVLSERTLTNLADTLDNFHIVSERGKQMVEQVGDLITTNGPSISLAISNMVRFSAELDKLTAEMNQTVITNRIELTRAIKSLQNSAQSLQGLVDGVQGGKGLIGSVFKDEQLKANFSNTASNFATLSSNLNRYGLLYKPKQPKTNTVTRPLYRGNSPFNSQ